MMSMDSYKVVCAPSEDSVWLYVLSDHRGFTVMSMDCYKVVCASSEDSI